MDDDDELKMIRLLISNTMMAVVQDGWLYFVLIPLYVSVHDGEYTHCRIKNASPLTTLDHTNNRGLETKTVSHPVRLIFKRTKTSHKVKNAQTIVFSLFTTIINSYNTVSTLGNLLKLRIHLIIIQYWTVLDLKSLFVSSGLIAVPGRQSRLLCCCSCCFFCTQ